MEPLTIKGLNNTLILIFNQGYDYEQYRHSLKQRLASNPQLFQGLPVVFKGAGLRNLAYNHVIELQKLCLDHGMLLENMHHSTANPVPRDIFLRRHIRSGQAVHADGSVLVWGDVHEGAEIYAGQDIVVLGKLSGTVHAGCFGNAAGIVFALEMDARLIRIAHLTLTLNRLHGSGEPTVAFIDQGTILTRSYRTKEPIDLLYRHGS